MGSGGVFKKIRKVAAKFDLGHQYGKSMGLPDPSGDLFYGKDKALSPTEKADQLAKTQMDMQQKQADQATAEAAEQARASAQAIQLQADRANMTQAVADQAPVDNSEVDVQVGDEGGDAASRRKRFSSVSANAGGAAGPAIRI